MTTMWMVRGDGGRLYDDFRDLGIAGIGWSAMANQVKEGMSRGQLAALYRECYPGTKKGRVVSGASQVWRFVNEVKDGDWVITYSPSNRTYMVGKVAGPMFYRPEGEEHDSATLARKTDWLEKEVSRDSLANATKNSLGSTLTVFMVPEGVQKDVLAQVHGEPSRAEPVEDDGEEDVVDPLADIENQALERIKDLVSGLDDKEMELLVAGILRAMGYKTQVSAVGADRGKDIIASPDGFGFENPRIVVEVKHRNGQMGSQAIRSFLGGRHKDDRGLYVSTGGFTRDAYYEGDRANVPLTLWTLDQLVRALVDHYDNTDTETKRLVPLKRLYWPA